MLTTLDAREVITGGTLQSNTFSIKANGKAFKVLIDGLYSDKIRAVVRELSSNARDSHVAADCAGRPFDLQLPTQWEPVFRVRDYGVSLSHEDVMHLYTTVFESTKDGTNTQVGKLGLGSKSPFAYTDSFTVTAWLAGEKRTYSAYIGSDHVPKIDFMGAEETTEEDGLEVSFPLKTSDVSAFKTAAERVVPGFDPVPNITGMSITVPEVETVMSDLPLWRLISGSMGFHHRGAIAKQGCVLYPIDPNAIADLSEEQRAVLSSSFVIEFPIGDLEISASREALGYDARTCANIKRVASIIATDIRKQYEKEVTSAETYWAALVAYNNLLNSGLDDGIKRILTTNMMWKGKPLVQYITMSSILEKAQRLGVTAGGVSAAKIEYRRANKVKNLKWDAYIYWQLHPGKTTIYFENVKATGVGRVGDRIKYHRECNPSLMNRDIAWFKADPSSYAWKRVYARLGRPEMIDVATLPKPPVTHANYRSRNKVPVRAMELLSSKFSETTIVESDRIVYVRMERGDLAEPGLSNSCVYYIADWLRDLGYMRKDERVVAIPATHKRMIDRNSHWVHFRALAEQAVAENFTAAAAARADAYEGVLTSRWDTTMTLVRKMHEFGETFASARSPAGRLLARYSDIAAKMVKGSPMRKQLTARSIASRLGKNVTGPAFASKDPIKAHADAFTATYPLLADVNSDFNDDTRKRVIDYVNLVDASQPKSQSAAA